MPTRGPEQRSQNREARTVTGGDHEVGTMHGLGNRKAEPWAQGTGNQWEAILSVVNEFPTSKPGIFRPKAVSNCRRWIPRRKAGGIPAVVPPS